MEKNPELDSKVLIFFSKAETFFFKESTSDFKSPVKLIEVVGVGIDSVVVGMAEGEAVFSTVLEEPELPNPPGAGGGGGGRAITKTIENKNIKRTKLIITTFLLMNQCNNSLFIIIS